MNKKDTLFLVGAAQDADIIREAGGQAIVADEELDIAERDHKIVLMCNKNKIPQQFLPSCLYVPYGYASPADFQEHDPEGLAEFIRYFQTQDIRTDYSMASGIWYFRNIRSQNHYEAKTGFSLFDDENSGLCGGIHEGLHVLGAVSSNGKSTFCLQLADQIADRGKDVMFFALEQPARELMAKSLSRETYKIAGSGAAARDVNQILNNHRYAGYSQEELRIIDAAIRRYQEYAGHMYIIDAEYAIRHNKKLDIVMVEQMVAGHIQATGNMPVVMLDYLQILPGPDGRHGKDAVDFNVERLKMLSVKYRIPVMVISSFNRLSYTQPVDMTSFKESGLIEYSADFLYGLQVDGMDYREDEDEKVRKARVKRLMEENRQKKMAGRPVREEFKCLKQRNGATFSVLFDFFPKYSLFAEHKNVPEKNKLRI